MLKSATKIPNSWFSAVQPSEPDIFLNVDGYLVVSGAVDWGEQ